MMRAFSYRLFEEQKAILQSRGKTCGFLDCFALLAMTALLRHHRRFGHGLLRFRTELEVQTNGENIDTAFGVGGECQWNPI